MHKKKKKKKDTYFSDFGIVESLINSVIKSSREQRGQKSGRGHNLIIGLHMGDGYTHQFILNRIIY